MKEQRWVSFLSLFTSVGTLICCALPALFVALGMGAVVAGVVSQVPQLIWLSEHKPIVFSFAGAMLIVAGGSQYYARNLPCPLDVKKAKACMTARKWSKVVYGLSVSIFTVAAIFAFGGNFILN